MESLLKNALRKFSTLFKKQSIKHSGFTEWVKVDIRVPIAVEENGQTKYHRFDIYQRKNTTTGEFEIKKVECLPLQPWMQKLFEMKGE
jgi:hypothetical protein